VIKLPELLDKVGLGEILGKDLLVAVKIHFGVIGGYRTIRPPFIRQLINYIKDKEALPFLADTWGLKHVYDAYFNGLSHATIGAPILTVNGVKENFYYTVKVENAYHLSEVKVAGNIYDADVLVNFAHGKGHGGCGFGGAIKNLALGCTNREMRRKLHGLEREKEGVRYFQEGMIDVVKAVLSNKAGKAVHLMWLMDIVEHCDCTPFGLMPIVPDIGILASKDIVALEKASLDLINRAPPLPWSAAEKYGLKAGDNKFLRIHGRDPYIQVYAAEKAGLGRTDYKLIEI